MWVHFFLLVGCGVWASTLQMHQDGQHTKGVCSCTEMGLRANKDDALDYSLRDNTVNIGKINASLQMLVAGARHVDHAFTLQGTTELYPGGMLPGPPRPIPEEDLLRGYAWFGASNGSDFLVFLSPTLYIAHMAVASNITYPVGVRIPPVVIINDHATNVVTLSAEGNTTFRGSNVCPGQSVCVFTYAITGVGPDTATIFVQVLPSPGETDVLSGVLFDGLNSVYTLTTADLMQGFMWSGISGASSGIHFPALTTIFAEMTAAGLPPAKGMRMPDIIVDNKGSSTVSYTRSGPGYNFVGLPGTSCALSNFCTASFVITDAVIPAATVFAKKYQFIV